MKKLTLAFYFLFFTFYLSQAQSWQWGKRGGSADTYGAGPDETVADMATDPNGNVYVLSTVLQTGLNVDSHTISGFGGQDILISSFRCDGTYRWSKILGSNQEDVPRTIKTDNLGGIYVTGELGSFDVTDHVDADTSWFNSTYKKFCIVKFDSTGSYKWIRFPQPDTAGITAFANTGAEDMDVDSAGNSYVLCLLSPGAYAGGAFVVTMQGYHILKYDKNGNFLSDNPMQITYTGYYSNLLMKRDHQLGKYYITGNLPSSGGTLSFAGTPITQALFIGCFSNAGTLLWQKQNTSTYTYSGFCRADIDAEHNIYIAGTSDYFTVNDTFNGYVVVNTIQPFGQIPLVVKLDTDGNNIWAKNGSTNSDTYGNSVIVNGNEVDISGQYPGELKWAGYTDSLNLPMSSGYHIFITRFDASSGAVLGMDSLASTAGFDNNTAATTSDKRGNFYVGGDFEYDLTVNGTTLNSAGGGSDFFIAKYGSANCTCTIPVAGFTHTGNPLVSYTYTGTTGEDSVKWNFGDGGTSTAINPAHTYTATGTYTACVTVYTSCGNDSSCQSVHVIVSGVGNLSTLPDATVYPNPATEQLIIDNAAIGTTITLFNIMGQQVYRGTVTGNKLVIDTRNLPNGNYIIQLTDANGNRMNRTIVKE